MSDLYDALLHLSDYHLIFHLFPEENSKPTEGHLLHNQALMCTPPPFTSMR